jgi:hypothetical protein
MHFTFSTRHSAVPFRFSLTAALLLLGTVDAIAEEPVTVFLRTPASLSEQHNLEAVLRDLPAQKAKWSAFANSTVTYIVKQSFSGLVVPDPCEGLPIRVRVVHGKLQTAVYEGTGGRCHKGQPTGRRTPNGTRLYLTPNDFFQRIALSEEQLRCYREPKLTCMATSLWVTYDENLGLPTTLEDYSVELSDYSWSLEVSDIVLRP